MPNNFEYYPTIPNAPNDPSDDQPLMQINSGSISDIINVDHITFNTNGGGIHKQVTLKNEAAPGLGDGDSVIYANLQGGQSWPFFQNGLGSFQMLGPFSSLITPTVTATTGYTYLPGGIIIQFGQAALAASGTIIFPLVFPNKAISAVFTPTKGADTREISIENNSLTTSQFQYNVNGGISAANQIFWVAIGN